jgi:endonuclease YncB( thermonuclease family)
LAPDTQPEDVEPLQSSSSQNNSNGKHNWPPIITLSEAKDQFFASGSADLPAGLEQKLKREVTEEVLKIAKDYDVDVIEVIGHTDEQPIVLRQSNLDRTLLPYLQRKPIDKTVPADNAGLGLARAASVVRLLRSDQRLAGMQIFPLSGGPLIDVGDRLSIHATPTPAPSRRRIEIRLRRHSEEVAKEDSRGWQTVALQVAPPPTSNAQPVPENSLVGTAAIVDGDTFDLETTRIRLWGVDAIESNQPCSINGQPWDCAAEITAKLKAYLNGERVTCAPQYLDQYHRVVAKCSAHNADLGAWLVSQGLALDYKKYSKSAYESEEAQAKAKGLGIWRGQFVPPWEWRHGGEGATGSIP